MLPLWLVLLHHGWPFCFLSLSGITPEEDPYWDPVELERLIGAGELYLSPLASQLENAGQIKLFDNEARPCGQVRNTSKIGS